MSLFTADTRSIFATRLFYLRTRNGLTQQKLASLIGVTQQSIWKWETDRSEPSIDKLRRLAELFNVPTDVLLGLTDITDTANTQGASIPEYSKSQAARDPVFNGELMPGASVLVRASELEDVVQRLIARYMSGKMKTSPEQADQHETEESAAAR